MAIVHLQPAGGDPVEIDVRAADGDGRERYDVAIDGAGRVLVARDRTTDHGGRLHVGCRVFAYHAVRRGRTIEVWCDGRRHVFELLDRTAQRALGGPGAAVGAELTAPMPGTVLRINAAPGDAFAAHDALIVMESMKMELTLSAPQAGRVREVLCGEGDLVEMGALLVRLEPLDGDGDG